MDGARSEIFGEYSSSLMNGTGRALVVDDMTWRHRSAVVPFVAAALLTGCGSGSSSTSAAVSASTENVSSSPDVVVENYAFPAITVAPGTSIRLIDRDAEPHTVTADDTTFTTGPFDAKSPGTLIAPAVPGRYAFHCKIHPTMHGLLVVQQP